MPGILAFKNRDLVYREVNQAFCALVGRPGDQILGRSSMHLFSPEEAGLDEFTDRAALANGRAENRWNFRQGGQVRWLQVVKTRITGSNGQPAGILIHAQDIGEYRQTERALRDSEKKNATLFETLPLGIIYLDPDGRLLDANPAARDILGTSLEEMRSRLTGDSVWQTIHEDGSVFPGDEHPVMQALRTGRTIKDVIMGVYNPLKAEYRWINISATPLFRAGENTPYQVYATFEDITERRRNQEALRESEWRSRLISEMTTDYVFFVEVEPGGKLSLRWATENMSRMTGRTVSEAASLDQWLDIFHPDDLATVMGFIRDILAGAKPGSLEVRTFSKNGEQRWIQIFAFPNQDSDGRVTAIIGAIKDISERKQAETELRASEEKYRRIIESSPMGMHFYHVEADGRLIFAGANPSADQMLHIQHQSLVGMSLEEAFPPLAETEVPALYRRVARGETGTQTFEQPYQDGRFSGCYAVQVFQSSINNLVVTFMDISEQKRSREKIIQINRELEKAAAHATEMAAQAQAATLAKTRFWANISHEIRTPLNAVLGFAQLMLDAPEEMSERQRQRLDAINRSGTHLLALLNDVLEISKFETGAQQVVAKRFDLRRLLSDLEIVFRQRAEEKNLQFDIEGSDLIPRHIVSDDQKIRQVLINLLGNAVKFTRSGGVRLRLQSTPLAEQDSIRLAFFIEDSGPGIAPQEMPHLFEAFAQTRTGRENSQGTGLGLAICRQFARLMGGDVTVTSKLKYGSVFCFEIPVTLSSTQASPDLIQPRQAARGGQAGAKVLVAEDMPESLRLVVDTLEHAGFTVRTALNGKEAVEEFSQWHPDLILMDLRMPVMEGDEAIRRIRREPGGAEVKIIMLTAHAAPEDETAALAAGADLFMVKPYRLSELLANMRGLIGPRDENKARPDPARSGIQPTALSAEMLAPLSAETRKQFEEDLIRGRQDRLIRLVQQSEQLDPQVRRLLQERIEKFDYETLLQLLSEEKP